MHRLRFIVWLSVFICACGRWFPSILQAHHEQIQAPQREYLKSFAYLPFKEEIRNIGEHTLFVTVVDRAPHTADILVYIENAKFKRAVRGARRVTLADERGRVLADSVVQTDTDGVAALRYIYDAPLTGRITINDSAIGLSSADTLMELPIGTRPPSIAFLAGLGIVMVLSFALAALVRHR